MLNRLTVGEILDGGRVLAAIGLTSRENSALVFARFGPDYVTALWSKKGYSKIEPAYNRAKGFNDFLRRAKTDV